MGKRTFLNIQAKDVLISYQITLQIFLFIPFRSTIYISHTPSLYLTLIFNIYVRVCQRFQFHGIYVNSNIILDLFSLSKISPWLNKLKILYIHISDILDPNRSFRVNSQQQQNWETGKEKGEQEKMGIKITPEPTTVILFVFITASLEVSRDLEQLATYSAKARFYNLLN